MSDQLAAEVAAVGRLDVTTSILEVVCRVTGMGFAAVARVTDDRWIACAVRDEIAFGLTPGGELEVATTICHEIRGHERPVVIDHVAEDPVFRDHHTPALYGFQSYISVPIRRGGVFFGTLCAIDPRPAELTPSHILGMFTLFADLIGQHLDTQDRLAKSEAALLDERKAADLREQFIAVLGHDLRNPLASIQGAARLIAKTPLNERATELVGLMQGSVQRMAGLIDDVLDFTRSRLGGGIAMDRRPDPTLESALRQTVAELRAAAPERVMEVDIAIDAPIPCDASRMAQLLSNLLGNAVAHGDPQAPVRVSARAQDGAFVMWVANGGEPIPPGLLDKLFQPFSRASAAPHQQGLGLGLFIAAEIARAHGGELQVASDDTETRFSFRMPLA